MNNLLKIFIISATVFSIYKVTLVKSLSLYLDQLNLVVEESLRVSTVLIHIEHYQNTTAKFNVLSWMKTDTFISRGYARSA